MEVPEDYEEGIGMPLPNKFRRGLDALVLDYPGCEKDLEIARGALEIGLKKDFFKAFRIIKGKQAAFEHYEEMKNTENWIVDRLDYPGSEIDKRELQTWFHDNPPNEKNVKIFKERIEGLRNKNAAVRGDRSHPNIAALLKLKLTYPGCEDDVEEALQVHFSRPLTRFPDVLHSLKAKQASYMDERSHWRLIKLDDLELRYPNCLLDLEAVEDWHVHNAENRENNVLFHEIIEGMLEKEALYLEWVHQRRQFDHVEPNDRDDSDTDENRDYTDSYEEDDYILDGDVYEEDWGRDTSSFDIDFTASREELYQKRSISSDSSWDDEEREPELNGQHY